MQETGKDTLILIVITITLNLLHIRWDVFACSNPQPEMYLEGVNSKVKRFYIFFFTPYISLCS